MKYDASSRASSPAMPLSHAHARNIPEWVAPASGGRSDGNSPPLCQDASSYFILFSRITSVITEPEPAIIHFKNTRKSGFVCITLLSRRFFHFIMVRIIIAISKTQGTSLADSITVLAVLVVFVSNPAAARIEMKVGWCHRCKIPRIHLKTS